MVCNFVLIFYEFFIFLESLTICEHLPVPGCSICTVMGEQSGFCAPVPVPLVVDSKMVEGRSWALQACHPKTMSDVCVRRPRSSPHMSNHSHALWDQVSGSPLTHMSCQITIMGREKAVPGGLQYMGALVNLCKDHGIVTNGFSSSSITKEPQTSHEAIFIRTEKGYCFRLKKLRLAHLQRRGKTLLWPAAPTEWVLKGSLRTSMVCTDQQEGSCPKIYFGIWGHQWKSVLLLILNKHLPASLQQPWLCTPLRIPE